MKGAIWEATTCKSLPTKIQETKKKRQTENKVLTNNFWSWQLFGAWSSFLRSHRLWRLDDHSYLHTFVSVVRHCHLSWHDTRHIRHDRKELSISTATLHSKSYKKWLRDLEAAFHCPPAKRIHFASSVQNQQTIPICQEALFMLIIFDWSIWLGMGHVFPPNKRATPSKLPRCGLSFKPSPTAHLLGPNSKGQDGPWWNFLKIGMI